MGGGRCPPGDFTQKAGVSETNSSSPDSVGAVLTKPKARLCEPWVTMVFQSTREAGDRDFGACLRAGSFKASRSPLRGSKQFVRTRYPRLAKPRLGLNQSAAPQLAAYCRTPNSLDSSYAPVAAEPFTFSRDSFSLGKRTHEISAENLPHITFTVTALQ